MIELESVIAPGSHRKGIVCEKFSMLHADLLLATVSTEQSKTVQISTAEYTLGPGETLQIEATHKAGSFILPMIGSILVENSLVEVGELARLPSLKKYKIQNILNNQNVSFSMYTVVTGNQPVCDTIQKLTFDMDSTPNKMIQVPIDGYNFDFYLGKFDYKAGLEKEFYPSHSFLFCQNLSGSFEVNNRLLFEKDSLLFGNCRQLEIESLSPESILLCIISK